MHHGNLSNADKLPARKLICSQENCTRNLSYYLCVLKPQLKLLSEDRSCKIEVPYNILHTQSHPQISHCLEHVFRCHNQRPPSEAF